MGTWRKARGGVKGGKGIDPLSGTSLTRCSPIFLSSTFLFLSKLYQGKAMVAYTKLSQRRKKEDSERLRGERDQIKFIDLRFERWQAVGFRKPRRRGLTSHFMKYLAIVGLSLAPFRIRAVGPCHLLPFQCLCQI